ncbi:MAG TPA: VOC family protein [Chitinophagaceae bacterium]|jgi:PhnB protein|nr:VOC family protein [Chitinophagaceae bacterium]
MIQRDHSIQTTIAPWLTVQNAGKAVEFYKTAFDAIETYRLETPDGGLVVQLSVNGANFWVSGDNTEKENSNVQLLGGGTIRIILTINDPGTVFAKALDAGATQVFPVGEEHGWRLGRIVDPFGLHWEIGHPLS